MMEEDSTKGARRLSPERQLNNQKEKGMFEKGCGVKGHKFISGEKPTLINVLKGKKVKRKICETLLENGMITKRTKYICKDCLTKVDIEFKKEPTIENKDTELRSSCSITDTKEIVEHLKEDIAKLYKDTDKCSIQSLINYNPELWLQERPACLVGLLRKLCGVDGQTSEKSLQVSKIVELIYSCRNKNLILPLSFQENLLVFSLSRNKQLVSYNSKLYPAGSESSIARWMCQQAQNPVTFPEGLVRDVFDNEQIIGKSHRVRSDNKMPTSIITSHMYIVIDEKDLSQNVDEYSPGKWLFNDPCKDQTEKFLSFETELQTSLFRQSRSSLLRERMKFLDLDFTKDIVSEFISKKDLLKSQKTCVECGGENEICSKKCSNCGGLLIFEPIDLSDCNSKIYPYSNFKDVEVRANACKVVTGEPDLCNPSSFQNISDILYNLAARSGIQPNGDGHRKWLFVECDGGIYAIVEKLLFHVYCCPKCGESFYGKDSFSEHRCFVIYDVTPEHDFNWLLPMSGLLHIEMNACKAFFGLNWDVFMKDVCNLLGFKTPKAEECAKKCFNHHKTFTILEILYIALTDELLWPFMLYCKSENITPNDENYWKWCEKVNNPNYLYCQQMTLTFLHAIFVFRVGCRRGNADLLLAGRDKLSLLFYCRNHPRYQRIMAVNHYIETMMPASLKNLVQSSLTLSRTNSVGHYQGGDACLEELNREAKSWTSPVGVPNDSDWLKVFRNLDSLNEIKQNLLTAATGHSGKKECSLVERASVSSKEVIQVKALFRPYLAFPMQEVPHTSLSGHLQLSNCLHNITSEAEALRLEYHRSFISGESSKLPIVCVSLDEFQKTQALENNTKLEIQKKIFTLIDGHPEKEAKLMEELFQKTVKGKNKNAYIEFFHALMNENE